MRPIHILELRSVWGTGGGPEKTILLGAAQADPARFKITVAYIRDERDSVYGIDQRAAALGVDYVEIREKHSFDPSVVGKLASLIRTRDVDIVHAHEHKTDALAWWLARRLPFIPLTTAHGWTGHSAKERWLYYPADRWLMSRFPRVIAVSSEIKQVLVRAGASPRRVDVVLNSIDPRAFARHREQDASARASFGLSPTATVIGAVGRLEPQKNFPLLVDAFGRLARDYPEALLLIAGDGTAREALQARVQALGLGGRLRLLGHQSDVARLHHAFDVFVQSSDYEGTPNAVLEAMAFENPIVATAAGGTAEIARDRREALIVPCGDGPGLEAALRATLDDSRAARARATAARQRVEGELSFAARMRKVEAIYEDLTTRYPRVPRGRRVPVVQAAGRA